MHYDVIELVSLEISLVQASLDINVCVGVIVNGVVSPTKCPESLL